MLCDVLNLFKVKNNINVFIFLKLIFDMELDGFKKILFLIIDIFDGVMLVNMI